jgi:hypothetical protein
MPAPSQSKAVHRETAGGLVIDGIEMTFGSAVNAQLYDVEPGQSLEIRHLSEAHHRSPGGPWRRPLPWHHGWAWPGHDAKA